MKMTASNIKLVLNGLDIPFEIEVSGLYLPEEDSGYVEGLFIHGASADFDVKDITLNGHSISGFLTPSQFAKIVDNVIAEMEYKNAL